MFGMTGKSRSTTGTLMARPGRARRDVSASWILALFAITWIGCSGGDSGSDGGSETADSGETAQPTLKFTAIPDDNTTELREKYGPVADYLSEQLGVEVEYVPSADYGASVEMFKNGDVHLAWFGGLTGVQARQAVDGARAIVQGAEDPQYFSYFIANASTGLEESSEFPAAIADLKFTFGSSKSTSGRLMPEFFIREESGKTPEEFFANEYGFSGSHNKTVEQVASGAFDVGACSYKTYDAMVADGKVDPEVCKVIWKTPYYADYNFTAHPELDAMYGDGFTDRLAATLIGIKDDGLLNAFRRSALIPATNAEFDKILGIARDLELAR